MSVIAQKAGVAVANLYRYCEDEEALFEAAVPRELVARFERLLERSVQAHAHLAGLSRSGNAAAADELLEFWIEHRLAVIVLLERAHGSVYQDFGRRFVERLVALSLAEIRRAHPGVRISREARLVLEQIFDNTRRMLGTLLESCADERPFRRAVAAFRAYQTAGLAAPSRWLVAEGKGGASAPSDRS